jgi:subtilisin family serine protease
MRLSCSRFVATLVLLIIGVGLQAQPSRLPALNLDNLPDSALLPGAIAIKLSEKSTIAFQPGGGQNLLSGVASLDVVLQRSGAYAIDSLFATSYRNAIANENGAAINHMNAAGLHRWFTLHFSNEVSVKQVYQWLQQTDALEAVAPFGKLSLHDVPNDPRFGQQWHLQNSGQNAGTPGADIKALGAWDIQTGDSNVLVSVHDGGILTNHEDLRGNIWHLKGFNFVSNTPQLTPDLHGTHVAGLLAAVRNNGLGVSGVAGGNLATGNGPRLMSLQIVGGTPVVPGYEANSFVYAANNGAAISQNSWSYNAANFFPAYTADAIDYFIANGGGQLMKGGIVIFSAGNFATEATYYPQAYEPVLAVSATNHRDLLASYSNFGRWTDLCAPGGDLESPILSTINNGDYGNSIGTSMACPLVSGGAALLLSHLRGRVLPDDIRSLLLYGTDNIYPLHTPFFAGKLGAGRLNLQKALQRADSMAQLPALPLVAGVQMDTLCGQVRLRWEAPGSGQRVMVAMETGSLFIGLPYGKVYSVGDTIPFGGIVKYMGTGNEVVLDLPVDGTPVLFRLWTTNADGSNYSVGTDLRFQVPQTLASSTFSSSATAINISWQRQCPQRGLLLAYSEEPIFGTPSGDPENFTVITGGGTKLYHGNGTSFMHTSLLPDKAYYYAFYPYLQQGNEWVYGLPQKLNAFTQCQVRSLPIQENFAGANFPPADWRITDGGPNGSAQPDGRTWQRNDLAGSTDGDTYSALLNAYTQNGNGSKEVLRSPAFVMNAQDSVFVSFEYAYRAYSDEAALADSLELVWSPDCGGTLQSIWKAGGTGLATVPGFSTAEFVPASASEWKQMRFALNGIVAAGTAVNMAFRGTNKFGQNIWLDNIRIETKQAKRQDAAIVALASTTDTLVCNGTVRPSLLIANRGNDSLRSVQVKWLLNGTLTDSVTIHNLGLAPAGDTTISPNELILNSGINRIRFSISLPDGQVDADPTNDTLLAQFALMPEKTLPLLESFEAAALPASAFTSSPITTAWTTTSSAAWAGSRSAFLDRLNDPLTSGSVQLFSPVLPRVSGVDSVLLRFAYATAMRQPAGQAIQSDTLEIYLTNDCGKTRQLLDRRAGASLATTSAVSNTPFVPARSDWSKITIDLTPWLARMGTNWQVEWRVIRGGGNHFYLDEVAVETKTISPDLKAAGFGIYPNPFGSSFLVWHLRPVPNWRSARLMTMGGKVLQSWSWNGNAPQTLQVNGALLPQGMYLLQLQYDGSAKTYKMMKR